MQYASILLALAATVVSAQGISSGNADVKVDARAAAVAAAPRQNVARGNESYPYYPANDYFPGCTKTTTHPATYIITDYTVSTYCPKCDAAKANGDVYLTTYETVYKSLCPTGLVDATYTVVSTTRHHETLKSR
jgi:hypothetical protein